MPNNLKLTILCTITVAILIATISILRPNSNGEQATELWPQLTESLAELNTIRLKNHSTSLTLIRSDKNLWTLKERDQYPVHEPAVLRFIDTLSHLSIIEAKTSLASNHAKLHLNNSQQANSEATLLELIAQDGQAIVELLVGIQQHDTESNQAKWYVRNPKESQVWLVKANDLLHMDPNHWLDQHLIQIDADEVQQFHYQKPNFTLSRSHPEDDFSLDNGDENTIAELPMHQLLYSVTNLLFEDVEQLPHDHSTELQLDIQTFDGLTYQLEFHESNKVHLMARAHPEADEAIQQIVNAINAKHQAWLYTLPPHQLEDIRYTSQLFTDAHA